MNARQAVAKLLKAIRIKRRKCYKFYLDSEQEPDWIKKYIQNKMSAHIEMLDGIQSDLINLIKKLEPKK